MNTQSQSFCKLILILLRMSENQYRRCDTSERIRFMSNGKRSILTANVGMSFFYYVLWMKSLLFDYCECVSIPKSKCFQRKSVYVRIYPNFNFKFGIWQRFFNKIARKMNESVLFKKINSTTINLCIAFLFIYSFNFTM